MKRSLVPPAITTEFVRLSSINDHLPAWTDLCRNAVEPNFFYHPRQALAAARHLDSDKDLRVLLVWQEDAENSRRLIGLFPFSISRFRWGMPVKLTLGWINNYSASSAPLLRLGRENIAIRAFLDWLDHGELQPRACMLNEIALQGPAMRALKRGLQATARPWRITKSWSRALLESDLGGDAYITQRIGRSTRQGMRRKFRRLSDRGKLTFHIYEDPENLAAAVEDFIALEARGWKGKAGTAIKCKAETLAFAREAFTGSEREARTRIDMLRLDGRPVSISITVISGDTGWYLKPTYDESLGKFSPGMLAQIENLKNVLDDGAIEHFDSACVPGHVIEKIWTGRKHMGDILFAGRSGQSETHIARLAFAEDCRHKARTGARALRDRAKTILKKST